MGLLPDKPVYALFSGGKDSFATAKVLQEAGLLKGVIMFDTGIASPEWEPTCRNLCDRHGFRYEIIPTPVRYEWYVWRYGFPGPGMHGTVMNYLKGRCVREFKRLYPGDSLASGVRSQESERRSFNTKPVSVVEGVTVYAPIHDWSTSKVWEYVTRHGYEKPRSYLTLGVSGDCLCGAFARDHERAAIKNAYPEVDRRLMRLETLRGECWGQRSVDKRTPKDHGEQMIICHDCER